MLIIPTGRKMKGVIQSVEETESSKLEQGGHTLVDSDEVIRWDPGNEPVTSTEDGNIRLTISAFKVNGKYLMDTDTFDPSRIDFWWHVHAERYLGFSISGGSNPSKADYSIQNRLKSKKNYDSPYKGNTFVIGTRRKTVTFFSNHVLITISYEDFKKMGGQ